METKEAMKERKEALQLIAVWIFFAISMIAVAGYHFWRVKVFADLAGLGFWKAFWVLG